MSDILEEENLVKEELDQQFHNLMKGRECIIIWNLSLTFRYLTFFFLLRLQFLEPRNMALLINENHLDKSTSIEEATVFWKKMYVCMQYFYNLKNPITF